MEQDAEYLLLTTIHDLTSERDGISQRDLSKAINMSLGMTNALIKKLSQKGFILMQKASPRNVSYALTPDGINELARRTYRYIKRTMGRVVDYKESIMTITSEAKDRGFLRIGLLGPSDLDFIVEYAAHRCSLPYVTYQEGQEIPKNTFVFVSESIPESIQGHSGSTARIRDLLGVGL
jgi:DNA-binding MarR family transcriptional regulator